MPSAARLEAPKEERGRLRRESGEAVVGARMQDHCAGQGWWLGCAQELSEGQGQAHMASICAKLKSRESEVRRVTSAMFLWALAQATPCWRRLRARQPS